MIKLRPHRVDYYSMSKAPSKLSLPVWPNELEIEFIEKMSIEDYRFMFDNIGGQWNWTSRKLLNDNELKNILHDPDNLLWVLKSKQEIIGYVELDKKHFPQIEILFFGLTAKCIGKGYGQLLMKFALYQCWNQLMSNKVWLHTCEFDHPKAGQFYLKSGFVFDKSQIETSKIQTS